MLIQKWKSGMAELSLQNYSGISVITTDEIKVFVMAI